MTPQWVAAWAAVGTAVIYIVLGIFAAVQVLQARQTRELAHRPYVVVDFDFRRFLVYISIKNIGQTPARNVSVVFDKPLQTVNMRTDPNKASVFAAPIPMIAPGRNIRVTFGISHQLLNDQSLPKNYQATVQYDGAEGSGGKYRETYVLDLAHIANTAVDPKGVPDLVTELEAIRQELHKWTAGGHGLLAFTADRDRCVVREERGYWREQARSIRSSQGLGAYIRWLAARQLERRGWR